MKQVLALLIPFCTLFGCNQHNVSNADNRAQAENFFDHGNAQFQKDEYEASIQNFTRSIQLLANVNDRELRWSVFGSRGLSYFLTDKAELGIADTTEALQAAVGFAPDEITARLYYQRGMMHLALDDHKSHNEDFLKAHDYDPSHKLDPLNENREF